jgi:endonuclease/exonuclease/phosphatase family metal-dependent hydrolase
VSPEHGDWPNRLASILRWIDAVAPTILALQEVDIAKFESDLSPALQLRGYAGRVQQPKHTHVKATQPCGVATFWKSDRFSLVAEVSKSRTMALHFASTEESRAALVMINVHLEAAQSLEGADRRARQAGSVLEWAQKAASGVSVILCGDFNTGADSPLHHVIRRHQWHGHDLASVYEHPAAKHTIPTSIATFAGSPHLRYLIDHMW